MDLVTPDLGLIFWTGLTFLILLFVLTKFIWKPILSAVKKREANIQNALDMAKKTKAEMEQLQTQNQNLLKEARVERDQLIKDAKATTNTMIDNAKAKAQEEANKIVEAAKASIETEKNIAANELKSQVAAISLEIAEKILRNELSTEGKQAQIAEDYVKDINLN